MNSSQRKTAPSTEKQWFSICPESKNLLTMQNFTAKWLSCLPFLDIEQSNDPQHEMFRADKKTGLPKRISRKKQQLKKELEAAEKKRKAKSQTKKDGRKTKSQTGQRCDTENRRQ